MKVFPSPIFWSIIIIGVFLDIVTKHFATTYLLQQVDIFGNIVYFLYTENTGIAFSLPLSGVLLQLITVILTGVIAYYYFQERKKLSSPGSYGPSPSNKGDIVVLDMSFGLILAGAIGNGIERIFQGYVVDFIGVQHFAIFNLADSFISIGAALYLYLLFTQRKVFKTKL